MKNRIFLILGFVLITFINCKKEDPIPITADIVGSVGLFDEGTTDVNDSGMKVYIQSKQHLTAISSLEGSYTIKDVPFGGHLLIFEKEGFGTHKIKVRHDDNGSPLTIPNINLGQKSATEVTKLSAEFNDFFEWIEVYVTIDPIGNQENPRYVRLIFHIDSSISNSVFTRALEVSTVESNPHRIHLTKELLNSADFTSGSTLFVRAYGDSYNDNAYSDTSITGGINFPNINLNTVEAVSFVVP